MHSTAPSSTHTPAPTAPSSLTSHLIVICSKVQITKFTSSGAPPATTTSKHAKCSTKRAPTTLSPMQYPQQQRHDQSNASIIKRTKRKARTTPIYTNSHHESSLQYQLHLVLHHTNSAYHNPPPPPCLSLPSPHNTTTPPQPHTSPQQL